MKSAARKGVPLSERQAIQWWVADAATKIHAARLMTYEAAARIDRGEEARTQVSMIKVFATEMAWEIIDHAMQTFGAMGISPDTPLADHWTWGRALRFVDGPDEVHLQAIARIEVGLSQANLGASAAYLLPPTPDQV